MAPGGLSWPLLCRSTAFSVSLCYFAPARSLGVGSGGPLKTKEAQSNSGRTRSQPGRRRLVFCRKYWQRPPLLPLCCPAVRMHSERRSNALRTLSVPPSSLLLLCSVAVLSVARSLHSDCDSDCNSNLDFERLLSESPALGRSATNKFVCPSCCPSQYGDGNGDSHGGGDG